MLTSHRFVRNLTIVQKGDCVIGSHTKLHADVHIGKMSKIGSFVWLFPEVLLTNDPTPPSYQLFGPEIGDFTVLAAKVLVLPKSRIRRDCVVVVGSILNGEYTDGKLIKGNPGKVVCDASILRDSVDPTFNAYPRRHRFQGNYPKDVVEKWLQELDN